MKLRYTKWNNELFRQLKDFKSLLQLFNYLVLQTSGDVEKAFRLMQYLQKQGILDSGFDLSKFKKHLEDEEIIKKDKRSFQLTNRGERQIRSESLKLIFNGLKKGPLGDHNIPKEGMGTKEHLPEMRKFQFGDEIGDINFKESFRNSFRRSGLERFSLSEDDLTVHEVETSTSCATVLLLDISHSMILYGEDRITPAKQVALALTELIQTQFSRDSLNLVLFGDEASEVKLDQLPYVEVGPFYTNTKAGLQMARQLLLRKKNPNKQIFLITDGKPSLITKANGQVYRNSVGLDPIIVNRTLDEAVACRRKKITITTFMIASDPYLQNFVKKLTELNKGRAYFTSPDSLGEYIFWDFISNRRRKLH
ncbi:MAG: VWA domain-containing protein [candidate division Zixibacteria bacterium]|nr:VWA domain-containing protein [candidate division Zixibacteria bacterium]